MTRELRVVVWAADRDAPVRTPLLVAESEEEGLPAVAIVVALDAAGATLVDLDVLVGAVTVLGSDSAARGTHRKQHAVEVGEDADVPRQQVHVAGLDDRTRQVGRHDQTPDGIVIRTNDAGDGGDRVHRHQTKVAVLREASVEVDARRELVDRVLGHVPELPVRQPPDDVFLIHLNLRGR